MNQQQQASNSFSPADFPLKRKRGRPRKDKSQTPGKSTSYMPPKKEQSQNRGENAPVPPGFEQEQANGKQRHSVDTVDDNNNNSNDNNKEDSMVGQVVTGVIEASFEAGYLLSVRVGESDTSLRGIVFKPGHYVPVSAENDVAPSLQMIRRNEVPFPSVKHGQKRRGRQRSDHHSNGSPSCNQLTRVRSRQMPIVAVQTPHHLVGARGTVVPVVLQPVNLSNGAAPVVEAPRVASQPAHLAAFKGKHTHVAQATEEAAVPKGSQQTDSGSGSQPFEELVSVAKRMQGSPESSSKRLQKDSGLTPEQVEDLSKPLLVKPLQAIRSGLPDQSASLSHAFPERRTGKMTELLLAVQENLRERQMAESHIDFKSPKI